VPVQASLDDVAKAFVRPQSYSLDLDRLLLGRESSIRTASVGVLHIVIHSASDLPKSDAVGSCDPYVSISALKFHKPLFSTRTIIDTQNPIWEESVFSELISPALPGPADV
jgi:Ca2+-dependent lipid-binding protein